MENSVDPDDTAHYELSHLDLHCLQRGLYWSVGMKGLKGIDTFSGETTVKIVFAPLLNRSTF